MTTRARARAARRRGIIGARAFVVAAAVALGPAGGAIAGEPERFAYSAAITGEIDPGTELALERTIADASLKEADVLILRLDTPGGSATSTRAMIQDMLGAPMPVIVYVHPSGGRAGSAGLFMMLAADVAAMAPATNIGSATPVRAPIEPASPTQERIMRDLDRKFLNDSVAFARALAEERGHNADLAERMIRVAQNVTARRARRERLVDVIAPSEQELLRALDGFDVKGRKATRLKTAGLQVRRAGFGTLDDTVADVDNSSFARSLLFVMGPALALVALAVGMTRGPRTYRRWKRRRRARSRQ